MSDNAESTTSNPERLLKIALAIIVPIIVWVFLQTVELSGNQFTASDGLGVWKEISLVKQDISKVPTSSEFQVQMGRIEDRTDSIGERLARIEGLLELLVVKTDREKE